MRLRPSATRSSGTHYLLATEEDARFLDSVAVGRAEGLEAAVELALADAQTEP